MSTQSPAAASAATFLGLILFLMVAVVLYGCLLAVFAGRARRPYGFRRPQAGAPSIAPSRRDARAGDPVTGLSSPDRKPGRFLVVVSRQAPFRYQELSRIFGRIGNTEVIFDRRHADRRSQHGPTRLTHRQTERRQRHIEDDLRMTGWALLRLTG